MAKEHRRGNLLLSCPQSNVLLKGRLHFCFLFFLFLIYELDSPLPSFFWGDQICEKNIRIMGYDENDLMIANLRSAEAPHGLGFRAGHQLFSYFLRVGLKKWPITIPKSRGGTRWDPAYQFQPHGAWPKTENITFDFVDEILCIALILSFS